MPATPVQPWVVWHFEVTAGASGPNPFLILFSCTRDLQQKENHDNILSMRVGFPRLQSLKRGAAIHR